MGLDVAQGSSSDGRAYRWLAVAFAVLLACSRLPALFAAAGEATPERVFLGYEADAATAVDLHYYASYVLQAREQPTLFFTDRATTEPQDGRIFSLYFAALGLVAKVTGASIPAVWNGARVLVVLLFCFALWKALGVFLPRPGRRFLAYGLVTFGGGLGWLMLLLRQAVGDSDVLALADLAKDGVIGYSTFGYVYHPQALLGETCFLGAVAWWARWRDGRGTAALLGALGCATLIFGAHSPSAPVFYASLLAAPLIPLFFRLSAQDAWARVRSVGAFLLPTAIFLAFLAWASGDPVFRGFAETYAALRHLREPLFWYPVGYGLVLWLAVLGARAAAAHAPERRDFLLGWLLASFVLSINALLFAWKFQFALQVPLCIFAAEGAPVLWEKVTRARLLAPLRGRVALAAGLLLLTAGLSSLFLFAGTLARAGDDSLFASADELDALATLAQAPRGKVLCRYRCGNLLISHTPHFAYIAHYSGTLRPAKKDQQAQAFFDRRTPLGEKQRLLRDAGIRYVVEGAKEREQGGVEAALGLRVLHRNASVRVFEVAP